MGFYCFILWVTTIARSIPGRGAKRQPAREGEGAEGGIRRERLGEGGIGWGLGIPNKNVADKQQNRAGVGRS